MKHTLLLFIFSLLIGGAAHAQVSYQGAPVKQSPADLQLKVYPNPVTTYININQTDAVEQMAIYSITGRRMKTFRTDKVYKHYVGDLPRGIYLVQLLGKKDKILKTQRITKR